MFLDCVIKVSLIDLNRFDKLFFITFKVTRHYFLLDTFMTLQFSNKKYFENSIASNHLFLLSIFALNE